jgi:hypothetical protein
MNKDCPICHRIPPENGPERDHNCDKWRRGGVSSFRCVLRECNSRHSRIGTGLEDHFKDTDSHGLDMAVAAGIVTHYYFPTYRNQRFRDAVGTKDVKVKPGITPRLPFAVAVVARPVLQPAIAPTHTATGMSANYARFVQAVLALPINNHVPMGPCAIPEKEEAKTCAGRYVRLFSSSIAADAPVPHGFYTKHIEYFDHRDVVAFATTEKLISLWGDFMTEMGLTAPNTRAYATLCIRRIAMPRSKTTQLNLASLGFMPRVPYTLSTLGLHALTLAPVAPPPYAYSAGLRTSIDDFIALFTPSSKVSPKAEKFRADHVDFFAISPAYPASQQGAFDVWHAYLRYMAAPGPDGTLDPTAAAHYFGAKMRELLIPQELDSVREKFRIPVLPPLLEIPDALTSLSPSHESVPQTPLRETPSTAALALEQPLREIPKSPAPGSQVRDAVPGSRHPSSAYASTAPPPLEERYAAAFAAALSFKITPASDPPIDMSWTARLLCEINLPDSPWKTKEGIKAIAIKDAAKGKFLAELGGKATNSLLNEDQLDYYMECYGAAESEAAAGEKRPAEDEIPLGAQPPPTKKTRFDG